MAATEQIGRSSYRSTKELLDNAALSHSRELSIRSSSLFGNIVNQGWAYEQNLEEKVSELRRKANADDFSVFEDPDIITVILTENSDSLIKALIAITKNADFDGTSISRAAAILGFYADLSSQDPAMGTQFTGLVKVIERIILPSIKVLDDKLFIVKDGNTADIYNSAKIGMLLSELDFKELPENYNAIGRELVNSVLQLADDSGLLPESAVDSGSGDLRAGGVIAPETLYPIFTDNPYYPAADYFYEETGEKISVLNQAERFELKKTDFGYRMEFDFPAGQTHTFAVRNIKPFYMMHLLGYRWNADHRFLSYSSGWWYDKQHNTLFVKINHRNKTEEILIYTEKPPEPVTQIEPSENETTESTSADGE
jgi:hypothetical protein